MSGSRLWVWYPWSESLHDEVAHAKRVCVGCPVRAACLDSAYRHREGWGIWGGKTTRERAGLLRAAAETDEFDLEAGRRTPASWPSASL